MGYRKAGILKTGMPAGETGITELLKEQE